MGVYIVKTHELEREIQKKEPYKTFLKKFHMLSDEEIWQEEISIDLSRNSWGNNTGFIIDRYYFFNPEMHFSFFSLDSNPDQKKKWLINHSLVFTFDSCFAETISSSLTSLKSRQAYMFLPDVEELEITYALEREEKAELIINAVTSSQSKLEQICMSLIGLDVAFFASGW